MRIISGNCRGKTLVSPTSASTRPTSDRARETIFNVLEHNAAFAPFSWEGKRVLDVFAGTGALGLEALSRGAQFCTFIEFQRDALACLQANIHALDMEARVQVLRTNATTLPQAKAPFDTLFLDPPYGKGLVAPTLHQLLQGGWVGQSSVVIIETGKDEKIDPPEELEGLLERTTGIAKTYFFRKS